MARFKPSLLPPGPARPQHQELLQARGGAGAPGRLRYGLSKQALLTHRGIALLFGIFRPYVSRRAYCKQCPEDLGFPLIGVSFLGGVPRQELR